MWLRQSNPEVIQYLNELHRNSIAFLVGKNHNYLYFSPSQTEMILHWKYQKETEIVKLRDMNSKQNMKPKLTT